MSKCILDGNESGMLRRSVVQLCDIVCCLVGRHHLLSLSLSLSLSVSLSLCLSLFFSLFLSSVPSLSRAMPLAYLPPRCFPPRRADLKEKPPT